MSLNKQMIMFITVIVIVLLLGTFAFNLNNTKNFLQAQLHSHAQDTATSLGLSLSTIPEPEDQASMETMINAVFDRGYYAQISLDDMENSPIYHRKNVHAMDDVPQWFIDLIYIETPSAEAMVQTGWIPIGILSVSSHAGFAYQQLWNSAKTLLIWFLSAALFTMLVSIYSLHLMLQPLRKMEEQAEAIVKKQYLMQENLPNTLEFRQVVMAMNAMIQKLKDVFERDARNAEKLQKMAFQDTVTGLSNRRHFEMLFESQLDPHHEAPAGIICLIRVNNLKGVNERFGYPTGDELIKRLSEQMKTQLDCKHAIFARLNGTELAALLPQALAQQLEPAINNITRSVPHILSTLKIEELDTSISIAYTEYKPGENRSPTLATLDFAMEQAENQGKNASYYYSKHKPESQTETWEETLSEAIEEHRFVLFQQSAFNLNKKLHSQELLVRMQDRDGSIRSAGYFMPAVEQLKRTADLDAMVLDLTFGCLRTNPDTPVLAINLSKEILDNPELQSKLFYDLNAYPQVAHRLAIELPEAIIYQHTETVLPVIVRLKELGVKVGIDHFGAQLSHTSYLQEMRPDYIKLDASFSKAIENDQQTRDYLSSLSEHATSLDIDVIAMAIENNEQIAQMKELGVRLFQGYLYGAPSPLSAKVRL